jgi:hypothetical protein
VAKQKLGGRKEKCSREKKRKRPSGLRFRAPNRPDYAVDRAQKSKNELQQLNKTYETEEGHRSVLNGRRMEWECHKIGP